MFGKLLFIIGLAAAGLLLVILNVMTPASGGAFGILAVFLLAYVALLVAVTFGLWALSRVVRKVISEIKPGRAAEKLPLKKAYYYASVIALAPVILVSLQSVGGVGVYELGLVLLFVLLGCVYIARRTK